MSFTVTECYRAAEKQINANPDLFVSGSPLSTLTSSAWLNLVPISHALRQVTIMEAPETVRATAQTFVEMFNAHTPSSTTRELSQKLSELAQGRAKLLAAFLPEIPNIYHDVIDPMIGSGSDSQFATAGKVHTHLNNMVDQLLSSLNTLTDAERLAPNLFRIIKNASRDDSHLKPLDLHNQLVAASGIKMPEPPKDRIMFGFPSPKPQPA